MYQFLVTVLVSFTLKDFCIYVSQNLFLILNVSSILNFLVASPKINFYAGFGVETNIFNSAGWERGVLVGMESLTNLLKIPTTHLFVMNTFCIDDLLHPVYTVRINKKLN